MQQLSQVLLRSLSCRERHPAIFQDDKVITWVEFASRVAGFAGLLNDLGLKDSGRVGMLADNGHRYLEAFFATPWAGGIFVPLNSRLAVSELEGIVLDAGIEILVADAAHADKAAELKARLPQLKHLVFASDNAAPEGWTHFDAAMSREKPDDAARGGDDVAAIYYTSGTTGKPKGVMITHSNLIAAGLSFLPMLQNDHKSICFMPAPMFHVASISLFMPAFTMSGAVVLVPKFTVEGALQAIKRHKATFGVVLTPMMQMLMDRPEGTDFDVSSMKSVSFGAASMNDKLLKGISGLFAGARLLHGYGMTETSAPVCANDLNEPVEADEPPARRGPTCIGRPLPGTQFAIMDADDRQVGCDVVGEIAIRGPTIMKGYWEQKEMSDQVLRGGWLHTGDLGYLDRDGHVYIVDRIKDMIKTGGENVYSAEVERVIAGLEGIAQCAVLGLPDDRWGEAVTAVVVLRAGASLTAPQIEQHCRKHLGGYKVPRRIIFRDQPFPMNSTNKILKNVVKAELIGSMSAG